MKFYFLILSILISSFKGYSQPNNTDNLNSGYPPDGVYFTFSSFRNGKPDVMKSQLVGTRYGGESTIRQWTASESLYYYDTSGARKSLLSQTLWGFCENGSVNILLNKKFHKISVLGEISYFLESYPVIKGNVAPVVTETRATSAYMLLDMETGNIVDYTVENLQELLQPDEMLYNEFKAITSLKTKKKKMYSFMERYNKAHPLRALEK